MNWGQKRKNLITMALLCLVCIALSFNTDCRTNRSLQDLTTSDEYLQGGYDEQHKKPIHTYLLSRKKKAYAQGRQDMKTGKFTKTPMNFEGYQMRSHRVSSYALYDHGPMYGEYQNIQAMR